MKTSVFKSRARDGLRDNLSGPSERRRGARNVGEALPAATALRVEGRLHHRDGASGDVELGVGLGKPA